MKDIKQKYTDYKTPFEETAWEHFQMIRNNEKPDKRKPLWLFFGLGILFIGLIGALSLFLMKDETSKQISSIDQSQTKKEIIDKKFSSTVMEQEESNEKTEIAKLGNQKETKNIVLSENKSSLLEENISENSRNQKVVDRVNILPSDNSIMSNKTSFVDTNFKKNSSPFDSKKENSDSSSQPKNVIKNVISASTLNPSEKNRNINPLSYLDSKLTFLNYEYEKTLDVPVVKTRIIKPHIYDKNSVRLSYNYANYYWNGALGAVEGFENPDKRGYLIQGEYYRNLNKLLAVGASLGYSFGEDIRNQHQDLLDYEEITFAHLNLYLFLVNSRKNKFFFKAGTGLTRTKRLSSFFILGPDVSERGLSYFDGTDRGLLVEFSYSRYFSSNWFLSANYGAITHNDGTWYAGMSLGYSF